MSAFNNMATATQEQVEAAKETVKLVATIEKFIQQSHATEQSNKGLTHFIIVLTIIQVIIGIIQI